MVAEFQYEECARRMKVKSQSHSPAAAVLFLFLAVLLCFSASPLASQGPSAQNRALYVWNLADELPHTDELLALCQSASIKHLYLAVSKQVLTLPVEDLDALVGSAALLGIQCHAVLSENTWALAENHASGLNRILAILALNEAFTGPGRFSGIHIDMEVHSLPEFKAAKSAYKLTGDPQALIELQDLMGQWLDFNEAATQVARTVTPPLYVSTITPQWFLKADSPYALTWRGVDQNVTLHLMGVVDEVVVLAYYYKPTKIAKRAVEEMAAAALPGMAAVRVAVNISHKSLPAETLWYGGLEAMEEALAHIQATYENAAGYAGTAIHMYESLRMLMAD